MSLDSQSYGISTYKLWKVQESLNKQDEGGPGPEGAAAALAGGPPTAQACVPLSPHPCLPTRRQLGKPGADLWAQPEAADLPQPCVWRCHSVEQVVALKGAAFSRFLDVKASCWARALAGGGASVLGEGLPCGV